MEKINYRARYPLMAMAIFALLAGLWGGLVRLGWGWPPLRPMLPAVHGPLMICAFLGTVIGVERAVALNRRWTYIGPILTGIGGVLLIVGLPSPIGPLLITLGSVGLVLVFGLILRMHTAIYTVTMALGTLLWLVGNALWLAGWPIYTVVYWWAGFLILTIAGERLELNRILRLSGTVQLFFVAAVGLFLIGLVVSLLVFDAGVRLLAGGMLALALWLLRYDIARYTARKSGLTRYIAVCLLTGYSWLAVSGILVLIYGGVGAGFQYDAILHAVFVGFIMSMIFGHAPIIFPAVIGKPIPFQSSFYIHLSLLHLSLLLRVAGDLTFWLPGRQWGGLLNVVAILLFMANTVWALRRAPAQTTTPAVTLQKVS
jgi:hypothetical protein